LSKYDEYYFYVNNDYYDEYIYWQPFEKNIVTSRS